MTNDTSLPRSEQDQPDGTDGVDQDPIEELLDVLVYAPLGLALELPNLLPEFIARGRKQVTFARSIGKLAVRGLSGGTKPKLKPSPRAVTATRSATTIIEGYNDLTAPQVVARLAACTANELASVEEYERTHKARVTVLRGVEASKRRLGQ